VGQRSLDFNGVVDQCKRQNATARKPAQLRTFLFDIRARRADIRRVADIEPAPAPTGPEPPRPSTAKPAATRFVVVVIVAVIAFLAGFIPGWLKTRSLSHRVSEMRHVLALSQVENRLAAATLDANRGQHEQARQSASQFFTQLRDELDLDKDSALTPAQREEAKQLLNQRDDIITLLARSDPSSSKKLSDLYVAFRKIIGNPPPKSQ
jgi:hypothetical protein